MTGIYVERSRHLHFWPFILEWLWHAVLLVVVDFFTLLLVFWSSSSVPLEGALLLLTNSAAVASFTWSAKRYLWACLPTLRLLWRSNGAVSWFVAYCFLANQTSIICFFPARLTRRYAWRCRHCKTKYVCITFAGGGRVAEEIKYFLCCLGSSLLEILQHVPY